MRRMMIALALVAACGKGGGKGGGKRDSEAQIQLDNLSGLAKRYFYKTNNGFLQADVGLTPAKACCDQPDHVCAPSPSDWELASPSPTSWGLLHFKITDQPFHFQYSYKGDATTYTATAVGDPDCDGHKITVTAKGSVTGGEPTVVVTVDGS